MKIKQLLLFIFIGNLIITNSTLAQSFQTGAGLRFGGLSNGLTIKHFISKVSALEGILSFGHKNSIVTGLYEIHTPVDHSSLFSLFYGVGGHIVFFRDGGSYYYNNNHLYAATTVSGIDAILGLNYTFKQAHVNVGMDFKPFIDFYNASIFYFDGGVSVRYTF